MTIAVSNTANSQTFGTLQQRFNQLAALISSNIVTIDSSASGSISNGNAYVNGNIGVSNLFVSNLSGGTLTTGANISVLSNTIIYNGISQIFSALGNSTASSINLNANALFLTDGMLVKGQITFSNTVNTSANLNAANLSAVTAAFSNSVTVGIVSANSTVFKVGANVTIDFDSINLGNSTVNSQVNSTAIGLTGQTITQNGANLLFTTGSLTVGANVAITNSSVSILEAAKSTVVNSSAIALGNSTANLIVNSTGISIGTATVNSTLFSGTANNSTNFAGQSQAYYANVTSPVFTTSVNVGSNVNINTTLIAVGNSTMYGTLTLSGVLGVNGTNTLTLTPQILSIGNSTVNTTVNSTVFTGTAWTANNATNLGGLSAASYANTSAPVITTSIAVGANVLLNTSKLSIGNSTVNTTVNSTLFTGTSNNSTNFGGNPVAFYANVTTPSISGSVAVGANVLLDAGKLFIGNSTVNTTVNSTLFTGTANNSTNFAGQGASYYANATSPIFATSANVGANVSLGTAALTIGNSTVNTTVNSTVFTGTALSANNSAFLGGLAAAGYANTSAPVITTSLAVGSNVTVNTSNVSVILTTVVNSTVNTTNKAGFTSNLISLAYWNGNSTVNTFSNNVIDAFSMTIGNSSVNSSVNSTALVVGGAIYSVTGFSGTTPLANNASFLGGNAPAYYANVTAPVFSTTVNVGANVSLGTSSLTIGNSTVNTTVNSTIFNGTANNATNFGGHAVAFFANVTTPAITTSITVGSNVTLDTAKLTIGNTTVNTTVNSTVFSGVSNNSTNFAGQGQAYYANITSPVFTTTAAVGANVVIDTAKITFGNSTVNTTVNSTIYQGTANAATYFGGQLSSFYAPIAAPTFTTSIQVGANVTLDTAKLTIGNTTVNTTVNSTAFNGTANNSTNFGGNPVSYYANISSPSFTTTASVGANVVIDLTKITFGNSTVNTTVNSTIYTGQALTANNSTNFAGQALGYFANVTAPVFSTTVNVGANVTVNTTVFFVGNSTVNTTVNSTVFSGTANNATNLGGTAAASYQLNSTLAANVAIMTSNNTNFLGGVAAASYVQNTDSRTLSGNLIYSGANVAFNNLINAKVGIKRTGGTANAYWLTNDGTGRNHWYWNTAGGLSPTFETAGEDASSISLSAALGTAGGSFFHRSAAGASALAGDPITWTTTLYVDLNTLSYKGTAVVINNGSTYNLTANNATNFGGHAVGFYANVTTPAITTSITVGSNVTLDTAKLLIGNSTVNTTVNSTVFTGTANNSLFLGGLAAANYANTSAPNFAGPIDIGSNVTIDTSNATISFTTVVNSTVNTINQGFLTSNATWLTYWNGNSTVNTYSNSILDAFKLTIGNSTVNAVINSTALVVGGFVYNSAGFSGTTLLANNANFLGGNAPAYYANVTAPSFTTSVAIGANVLLDTAKLTIGNTTVNTTVNSTVFTGTANNSTNFAGQGQAYYANVTAPSFSTTVSVGANVIIDTVKMFFGNSTVNSTVNSTIYSGVSNNSLNFAGQGLSYFANSTAPILSTSVAVGANILLDTSTLTFGNSTVNTTVNSTIYEGTANNATNLGGLAAANYANTSAPTFTTNIKVGANVTLDTAKLTIGNTTVNTTVNSTVFTGTANNSTNFAGQAASYFANSSSPIFAISAAVGSNVVIDTVKMFFGNSTVNSTVNSTIYTGTANNSTNFAGNPIGFYANVTTPSISTSVGVGANVLLDTAKLTIGNTTVNTTVNSTIFTGTANNSTNFAGQSQGYYANVTSPSISTLLTVGSNVSVNTSTLLIGNSTVFTSINSTSMAVTTINVVLDCGTF